MNTAKSAHEIAAEYGIQLSHFHLRRSGVAEILLELIQLDGIERHRKAIELDRLLRAPTTRSARLELPGGLEIDPDARLVTFDDLRVQLTRTEFRLLELLASNPFKVFDRGEIMNRAWGHDEFESKTLDTHVNRLRSKLREVSGREYVVNTRGVGYALCEGRLA